MSYNETQINDILKLEAYRRNCLDDITVAYREGNRELRKQMKATQDALSVTVALVERLSSMLLMVADEAVVRPTEDTSPFLGSN